MIFYYHTGKGEGKLKMIPRFMHIFQQTVFAVLTAFAAVSVVSAHAADSTPILTLGGYDCDKCYTICTSGYGYYTTSGTNAAYTGTSTGTSSCAACMPCATGYDSTGGTAKCTATNFQITLDKAFGTGNLSGGTSLLDLGMNNNAHITCSPTGTCTLPTVGSVTLPQSGGSQTMPNPYWCTSTKYEMQPVCSSPGMCIFPLYDCYNGGADVSGDITAATTLYLQWQCNTGYYMQDDYSECTPCTGLPDNAQWTGPAPEIDKNSPSDWRPNKCPWDCTSGYHKSDDGTSCVTDNNIITLNKNGGSGVLSGTGVSANSDTENAQLTCNGDSCTLPDATMLTRTYYDLVPNPYWCQTGALCTAVNDYFQTLHPGMAVLIQCPLVNSIDSSLQSYMDLCADENVSFDDCKTVLMSALSDVCYAGGSTVSLPDTTLYATWFPQQGTNFGVTCPNLPDNAHWANGAMSVGGLQIIGGTGWCSWYCDDGFHADGNTCVANNVSCGPGTYFDTTTGACSTACQAGYYCPGGDLNDGNTGLLECPDRANGATSDPDASDITDCYKACPTPPVPVGSAPDGCVVTNHQTFVAHDDSTSSGAAGYDICTFDVAPEIGYTSPNGTTNLAADSVACNFIDYTVTFNLNGGALQSGMANPGHFKITDLAISSINTFFNGGATPTRAASTFVNWLNASTNAIVTGIPKPDAGVAPTSQTLNADWDCVTNAYAPNATSCAMCPNNGTSAGGDITIADCQKDVACTSGGNTGHQICGYTSGTGSSAIYSTNCESTCHLTGCAAGSYLSDGVCQECAAGQTCTGGEAAPSDCPANSYCPSGNSDPIECPNGGNAPKNSTDATACYLTCTVPTTPANCATITAANSPVHITESDGATYDTCTFNVTANTGYQATDNGTATPSCQAIGYKINYVLNGGTLLSGAPTTYNATTLPVTLIGASRENSNFVGWYDADGKAVTTIPTGTINDITLTAKWTCVGGLYPTADGQKCQPVGTGYYSPDGDDTRHACETGFTTDTEYATAATDCFINCTAGYQFNSTQDGCEVCADTYFCPNATKNYYKSTAALTGQMICPATADGSDLPRTDDNNCFINCPTMTIANALSVMPVDATPNYVYHIYGDVSTGVYPTCMYNAVCADGFLLGANGTVNPTCTTCYAGSYCTGGVATTCPDGSYAPAGSDSAADCEICTDPYVCTDGTRTTCPAGEWPNATHTACESCPIGKVCKPGSTEPENCDAGYEPANPPTSCEKCDAGMISQPGAICTTCADGMLASSDGKTCGMCPAGHTCSDGLDDGVCADGKLASSDGKSCGICPIGHTCSDGLDNGACADGKLASSDGKSCGICPIGHTCHDGLDDGACADGAMANAVATSCDVCTQGMICTGGVAKSCQNGEMASSDGKTCITCADGHICPGGIDMGQCADGKLPNSDKTECTACPAGEYCVSGTAFDCPLPGTTQGGAKSESECYTMCLIPTGQNGIATSVPSGDYRNYWTGSLYDKCTFDLTCKSGYTVANDNTATPMCNINCTGDYHTDATGNKCESNTISCTTTDGKAGYKKWLNGTWSACAAQCPPDQQMLGGKCTACDIANATGYKTGANCYVTSCMTGFHPNIMGSACESDTKSCTISNATTATMTWTGKTFGVCTAQKCNTGYHIAANACVQDTQTCKIENGTGEQTWTGNGWGVCEPTKCNPGYTSNKSLTNETTKACGACRNSFGVFGEIVATNYTTECDIASCLYQGELYNLEANECVPICDPDGRHDETGTMTWDKNAHKCIRQCNDGYTMW